ncbi:MAG TPA: cob(I)yrinic acid a,c-diamide adenosyltransferase, partial [Acidobacteriaceae bacterium]
MADTRRGLILINTGPGKGKTTAALGTALRAVGCGMKVLVLQFIKGSWHYGELDAAETLGPNFAGNFVIRQMGRGFVKIGGAEADPEDIRLVQAAWEEARAAIDSGEWDLVVLD